MAHQQFTCRCNWFRRHVVEIDALQCLIDMQLSRFTVVIHSVPIENAISRVAILLDLDQEVSGTDGVKASRGKKHSSTAFHPDRLNTISYGSRIKDVLELIARHRFPETHENFGIRFRRYNVPKFGFGFAA